MLRSSPDATSPAPEATAPAHVATPILTAVPPLGVAAPPRLADAIPDPSPLLVRALAISAFEVLDGTRTVAQLGSRVSPAVAARLSRLRALQMEAGARRRRVPRARGVRIERVSASAAEAAAVLDTGVRVHAVALRLEVTHGRWRASELVVL